IQKKRRDLRVIVASATLDAKKFHEFFNLNESGDPNKDTCGILTVEGRTFPVDIFYTVSPVPDYVKATVETVMKIHEMEDDGDVLAFLTGQEEVEKVVSLLQDHARSLSRYGMKKHLRILPMYSGLPYADQMKVFERAPSTVRKIVVATNIAETSITINGIMFVIDCAFVKLRAYNPRTAIESLVVTPISKASASQRAGRSGRNRPGKCFRLYTVLFFYTGDPDVILKCIVSGFFANAARIHHSGSYRVVFNEVVQTSKYYMRDVTAVESSWLVELAPHFYKQAKVC
ncbi:hypothetical protein GOODEAATRI_011269, partial [Goodea atripinnis]